MGTANRYSEKFSQYFGREVAKKAAKSISDGSEIEIQVAPETFTFTKEGGKNAVKAAPAGSPQLVFILTPEAADAILADTSEEIGPIGVLIAKMVVTPSTEKKISIQFKAGFLTLFTQGYFGVLTSGGSEFASFLASKGLSGMSAIKDVLKKMKA